MIESSPTSGTELSAYEKAASEGNDPRCIPQHLTSPPPIGDEITYPEYPDIDHTIWNTLFNRQMNLLPGRAGEAYLRGIELLQLVPDRIPSLHSLSSILHKTTNWKIARIPGLLHERDFFNLLAQRVFPSTDYIRGEEELDYTPAPDLFHDIFGHMPMLTVPAFADFYQMFGQVALSATGKQRTHLERLHWFTVEFGLIKQEEGTRIFGAGILSSKEEVVHALSDSVKVLPFSTEAITEQDYDVWHLQDVLFVLESFDQLTSGLKSWAKASNLL